MWGKTFRRIMSALLIIAGFLTAATAHAEIKIYTGEGKYVMSEGENFGVAKERAKADAMRNAQEQAGVYIRSYTQTRNHQLVEDEIITIASTILKLVEEPHFFPVEEVDNLEGILIRVAVKVQIDDSDINRWLDKDDSEKSILIAQNEEMRRAIAEQESQIAELKRQLAQANTPQETERITNEFANEDKIFLSNQKVEEAWKLYNRGDYNGAINLYDEAIQLNPENSLAYYGRGTAHNELKQYGQAIQDYDEALKFKQHEFIYNNRGNAYKNLQQYERAIQDYNKAIQLNPNNIAAYYYNRGLVYGQLNQYEQAIQDFDKAIQINPNFNRVYYARGICYQALGDKFKAQADFAKARQLGYNG